MGTARMGLRERADRTVLDLKTALAVTAKRLGINRIAATYGIGAQALYNNLNLGDTDRAPTLAQFELILEYAREQGAQAPILDSLGQIGGCLWIQLPQVQTDDHGAMFAEVAGLVGRVGTMVANVETAVADGVVDQDELAILERDLLRLLQSGYRVVEAARTFGGEV
ncbi:hypothetical protein GN155_017685 [Alcanivorax sp. ZXX171]|nr:hypothetical protein [Alcanivorax sp. ZXX171]